MISEGVVPRETLGVDVVARTRRGEFVSFFPGRLEGSRKRNKAGTAGDWSP